MAIVKMKRIRLIALESDRAELFRRLQRMGCLHLSEPPSDSAQWEDLLHREDDHTADRQAKLRLLQNALDTLKRFVPQKTGLLTPRPMVSEADFLDESTLADELAMAREVNDHAAELNRLGTQETRLLSERASLAPWAELDVPMDFTATRAVDITTGTVPGPVDFEKMQAHLAASSSVSSCSATDPPPRPRWRSSGPTALPPGSSRAGRAPSGKTPIRSTTSWTGSAKTKSWSWNFWSSWGTGRTTCVWPPTGSPPNWIRRSTATGC